ncbi:uncharacterized protein LOC136758467 [Amia ocellicauda]|uniref:uncharacterized protein LOC136758467 n=1 Tax=Amia ocellicauda TaxID=2972642 RepID=UPI003464D17A
MVHNNPSISRSRVCIAGMALSLSIIFFFFGIYVSQQGKSKAPAASCEMQNRSLRLEGAYLSQFFRNSNTSLFFEGIPGGGQYINWKEVESIHNNLQDDKTVLIPENGYYLLFLQVTFKVFQNSCIDLYAILDIEHKNDDVQMYSATYKTLCSPVNNNTMDAMLNHPVVAWMQVGDKVRVQASPMQSVDFQARPRTTFLTAFKYA